jgi:hypothetical protein
MAIQIHIAKKKSRYIDLFLVAADETPPTHTINLFSPKATPLRKEPFTSIVGALIIDHRFSS